MELLAEDLLSEGFSVECPRLIGHGRRIEDLKVVPLKFWLRDAESALERRRSNLPVVAIGCSFGSLLSLHLCRWGLQAAVAMSTPLKLRSLRHEKTLQALSYAPDLLLNRLGVVPKLQRKRSTFARERVSLQEHSIAAGARLIQLRRKLLPQFSQISCPVLGVFDPGDHHIDFEATLSLIKQIPRSSLKFFPGGQHELTIGPHEAEVRRVICHFLKGEVCRAK